MADLRAAAASQQEVWATGDFAAIGSGTVLPAELLAEALDVRAGWRVLDVAAGHGNMSLAAARRGCHVTSTDFVQSLLERGRLRAEVEGFRIEFEVADAEHLPYADGAFDGVVSTFGVMFAPDQERAASELLRVCRVGGRIGLATWTPESFVARMFALIEQYAPGPGEARPAAEWGTRERLAELFAGAAEIQVQELTTKMRAPSARAWLTRFRTYFGPLHRAFAALDEHGQARLETELLALADGLNRSGDGTLLVPSEYLEVVMTR